MDNESVEEQVRKLAQPLWESAARPYGVALDFWLMAEQMVLEMMTASARIHKAISPPTIPPDVGEVPAAAPVARVRELAECMWDSAGRQYGMAQDFWLSAERHVLTMLRAVSLPSADSADARTVELAKLSPAAYLEHIRRMAFYSWETAGRNYGQALDYWLQAERDMLNMMKSAAGDRAALPLEFPEAEPPVDVRVTSVVAPAAAPSQNPTSEASPGTQVESPVGTAAGLSSEVASAVAPASGIAPPSAPKQRRGTGHTPRRKS
jgi:Protein of unknown function (DUF2934)